MVGGTLGQCTGWEWPGNKANVLLVYRGIVMNINTGVVFSIRPALALCCTWCFVLAHLECRLKLLTV